MRLVLQLTVPLAGASPLSVFSSSSFFFSTSTSFFSFSSYKIKACSLINVMFGNDFILKCQTFLPRLCLIERKILNISAIKYNSRKNMLDNSLDPMLNVFIPNRRLTLTLLWLPAHSSSSASPAVQFLPLCLLN